MKTNFSSCSLPPSALCTCCALSRRDFLAKSGAACAGVLGAVAAPGLPAASAPANPLRIRIVYSLFAPKQPRPTWPHIGFDFEPVMKRINSELAKGCKGLEFVVSMAGSPEEAQKILDADKSAEIAGYVVCQMNNWPRVVQTIATTGKPVLYADFKYGGSGGFLTYNAAFLRSPATNVGFVSSSETKDLVEAVKCIEVLRTGGTPREFVAATAAVRVKRTPQPSRLACKPDSVQCLPAAECLRLLKESKILALRSQESGPPEEIMGIPVVYVPFGELNEAWKAADPGETRVLADRWEKGAQRIEGVTRETIEKSVGMYLAQKVLLKKHRANAITINCLGGFYSNQLAAYPCLGFCQLLDEGWVGACECDIRSAAAMVAITTLTQGRPGYISDPVMDTAKREIIYSHCVATTKPFGPKSRANPYQILTHSEDRQGASLRSLLPAGYMVTTLEFDPKRKEIVLHQAKALGNDLDDRACRTKLRAEPVGDFEKLFTQWDLRGWHRVTFYGDLLEPVQALAEAAGWKIVPEA